MSEYVSLCVGVCACECFCVCLRKHGGVGNRVCLFVVRRCCFVGNSVLILTASFCYAMFDVIL